jgi:hypothetical protein
LELFASTEASGWDYLGGIPLTDQTATKLTYAHIASDEIWWTGVVAYNPLSSPSTLTISPYRADGVALAPQTVTLQGKQKYIGVVENLNLPAGTAWFGIEATSAVTGFELFATNDGAMLDGYTSLGISGTGGVFAKIEKAGWTGIAFVNSEGSAATVTLTAYNDNGGVVATQTMSLPAHAKVVDYVERMFSQDISTATYVGYSSDREIVGFQLNGSADNLMMDALPGL